MFTGLIEQIGTVVAISKNDLKINTSYSVFVIGESISVDGVCVTVKSFSKSTFIADVSEETFSKSTFSQFQKSFKVHLEKALLPTSRMGGHIVQGHVDGIGSIRAVQQLKSSRLFNIEIPEKLMAYTASKGSIALDGISLTVADIKGRTISISVIPHTMAKTHWQSKKVGSTVNIETDILAKYVERQLLHTHMNELFQKKSITMDMLAEGGF